MNFNRRSGMTTLEKILIPAAAVFLAVCVFFGFVFFNNRKSADPDSDITEKTEQKDDKETTEKKNSESKESSEGSLTTPETSSFPSTADTTSAGKPTAPSESAATVTTVAPTLFNTANMYSSYAFMVSFDPVTGWAEFDYFDMLRGDAAVDWLVAEEGYTLADAQAEVDNYADSEFITKNINPQLRTADMGAASITMMYYADGTQVSSAESVTLTYSKFKTLYASQPEKILGTFFYYVTVVNGVITKVDQVYWP